MLGAKAKIGGFENSFVAHSSNINQFDLLNEKRKDIYSLGVLCSELIFGTIVRNKQDYLNLINNKQIGYSIPSTLSSQIFDFVNKMLQYESNKQLTIDQICNDPFLKEDINNFNNVDLNDILKRSNLKKIKISKDDILGTSSMFSFKIQVKKFIQIIILIIK